MEHRAKDRMLCLLMACLLVAPTGALLADEHREVIRKVDVAELAESGTLDSDTTLASSGQPDEAALKAFSENGYEAVIDLRGANESRGLDEQAVVEKLGMSYVALPVSKAADMSFEKARELDEIIKSFEGPVLVHCGSGNRVGALLALRASAQGASDEEALELGRSAGLTRSENLVRERLNED